MLTEKDIQQALHARRMVSLSVTNPHGPLGLEQLAAAVKSIEDSPASSPELGRIRRPISLSVQTWEKLEQAAQTSTRPVTASELATAIIEQFVATASSTPH